MGRIVKIRTTDRYVDAKALSCETPFGAPHPWSSSGIAGPVLWRKRHWSPVMTGTGCIPVIQNPSLLGYDP